eukprot:3715229-Rhodomonas_salina.1
MTLWGPEQMKQVMVRRRGWYPPWFDDCDPSLLHPFGVPERLARGLKVTVWRPRSNVVILLVGQVVPRPFALSGLDGVDAALVFVMLGIFLSTVAARVRSGLAVIVIRFEIEDAAVHTKQGPCLRWLGSDSIDPGLRLLLNHGGVGALVIARCRRCRRFRSCGLL